MGSSWSAVTDADAASRVRPWRVVALLVTVSWWVSLTYPTVAYWNGGALIWVEPGDVLLEGWLGVFEGQFAWYANLIIWLSVAELTRVKLHGPIHSLTVGSILLICFAQAAFWRSIDNYEIAAFGSGYYCWMSAVGVAGSALVLRWLVERRSRS
jgi:hypothetical protein